MTTFSESDNKDICANIRPEMTEMGNNFIALGQALQDEKSDLKKISGLFRACGLTATFTIQDVLDIRPAK